MSKKLFLFITFALLALFSCSKGNNVNQSTDQGNDMTIKSGSTVSMNYLLTVDGEEVDSSTGKEPLTFVVGSGQIIPGLEGELTGLKKGDKKKVTVSPENGYGMASPEAIQKAPKSAFNEPEKMKVGDVVTGQSQGQAFQAVVKKIDKTEITLDFNHPLAGKTLNFDIEIMDVK